MLALGFVLLLPLTYLTLVGRLAVRGPRDGLILSISLFAATFGIGFWGMTQSRSSTAAIALIFLPSISGVAGLLGLAFAQWRRSSHPAVRAMGFLCLALSIVPMVALVIDARRVRAVNASRDLAHAASTRTIDANRAALKRLMSDSAVSPDTINSLVRARLNERTFLIAALDNYPVSSDLLDTLADNADLGVALMAVRHANTRPATLLRVHRTTRYPGYFSQDLAGNPNSPPELLRELHRARTTSNVDYALARNPSTPLDLLADVASRSEDIHAIRVLLGNPAVDCATMRAAVAGRAFTKAPRDEQILERITELTPVLCAASPPLATPAR